MKLITGYFIDIENGKAEAREIGNNNLDIKKLLRINELGMTKRLIGDAGRGYVIFCDDIARTKGVIYPGACCIESGKLIFNRLEVFGNIFVVLQGDEGDVNSLTDSDINYLKQWTIELTEPETNKSWSCLHLTNPN